MRSPAGVRQPAQPFWTAAGCPQGERSESLNGLPFWTAKGCPQGERSESIPLTAIIPRESLN
mgnify:CR=1 FL=1